MSWWSMSWWSMSWWSMSWWSMSWWSMCWMVNVLNGQCLDGQCLDGQCVDGQCVDGQCHDGQCLDGQCVDGQCVEWSMCCTWVFTCILSNSSRRRFVYAYLHARIWALAYSYMYVCIYICIVCTMLEWIHVCIWVYMHVPGCISCVDVCKQGASCLCNVCIYLYIYIYIHTYIHTYIHIYIHMYTYACMYPWNVNVCGYVQKYIHDYLCRYFPLAKLMYVCKYGKCTFVYADRHAYIHRDATKSMQYEHTWFCTITSIKTHTATNLSGHMHTLGKTHTNAFLCTFTVLPKVLRMQFVAV